MNGTDWEKAVAERDEKIAALETQVAEAAKNAETAEQLRGEIAELKAQGETCPQGETGATGATGPQGPAGTTPDLSAYATKQYVDDAIAALANLEEEEF